MSKIQQAQIERLLEAGHIIRVMDGRCGNGFVDVRTLNEMIAAKMVKVVLKQGLKFATRKPSAKVSDEK